MKCKLTLAIFMCMGMSSCLMADFADNSIEAAVDLASQASFNSFVAPKKFPDLPGVYIDKDELNEENVEIIDQILEPYYQYTIWLSQETNRYIKTKDEASLRYIAASILSWANAQSITIAKPWRFHYQKVVGDLFSSVKKIKPELVTLLGQEWLIVESWIGTIIARQIADKKMDVTKAPYLGNVGLKKMYNILACIDLVSQDKRVETEIVLNCYLRCINQGITPDLFYLGDIKRQTRTLSYTYSSLSYLAKIYNVLKKKYDPAILNPQKLNQCITFYNRDVDNKGLLYGQKVNEKQLYIKGKIDLVSLN